MASPALMASLRFIKAAHFPSRLAKAKKRITGTSRSDKGGLAVGQKTVLQAM